jgi:hypothetical protein
MTLDGSSYKVDKSLKMEQKDFFKFYDKEKESMRVPASFNPYAASSKVINDKKTKIPKAIKSSQPSTINISTDLPTTTKVRYTNKKFKGMYSSSVFIHFKLYCVVSLFLPEVIRLWIFIL